MAEKGEEQDVGGGAGSGKAPLATILLIVNALVMVVVAYLQFMAYKRDKEKILVEDIVKAQMKKTLIEIQEGSDEDGNNNKEVEGILLPLDNFTANLAQGDGPRRYVRLNLVLKFSMNSKEAEFKARKPQIRDTVISILNTKRPEDLLKIEGKQYLKEEIKASINSFLIDGSVINVFYVSFQIN